MTQETQVKTGPWEVEEDTDDHYALLYLGDPNNPEWVASFFDRENALYAQRAVNNFSKLLSAAKQALTHSDKETLFGRCGFCLGWLLPSAEDRGCEDDCAGRMLREAVDEAER